MCSLALAADPEPQTAPGAESAAEGEASEEDQAPLGDEEAAPDDEEAASDDEAGEAATDEDEARSKGQPPVVDPPVMVIPAYNLEGGLQTLETAAQEHAASADGQVGLEALRRLDGIDWEAPTSMLRGRWYVKPQILLDQGGFGPDRAYAVRAGGTLGRMWFTTGALPVQGGADVGLQLNAPIGQAVGYRAHLHALAGPWLGPVGLRLGPTVRADRTRWTVGDQQLTLDNAVLVGGRAVVSFDAGPIAPYVDLEPAWAVAGDRTRPDEAVALPALGTETRYGGGVTLQVSWLDLYGHVHWNETAIGRVLQVGGGLALRPRNNNKKGDSE